MRGMILASHSAEASGLIGLLICLIVVALVTAVVWFGGRELWPRVAGPAAFCVLLVGALVCLLVGPLGH